MGKKKFELLAPTQQEEQEEPTYEEALESVEKELENVEEKGSKSQEEELKEEVRETPVESITFDSMVCGINTEARVTQLELLNEAADLLLDQLVPSVRLFAEEIANIVLKIPRWQLLLGSLLAQFESGSLPAPSLDPSWSHDKVEEEKVCFLCGETFAPFKPFQALCSEKCGIAMLKGVKSEPINVATS